MTEVPLATRHAFEELAEVVHARGGEIAVPSEETVPEEQFVDALGTLDEDTVRALGEARADASLKPDEYQGDPLRMLKLGASSFYEDRCNYGAASLELTPKKAVVRFLVSDRMARSPSTPILIRGFLERAVEKVVGEHMIARFAGNTPRVGGRFESPMYNSVFEFDLDLD
ncbi:MAG: hypothetical protein ACXWUG_01350 [Polyangiales bacterium]